MSIGRGSAWLPSHPVILWRPLMGCRWSRSTLRRRSLSTRVKSNRLCTSHKYPSRFLTLSVLRNLARIGVWQDCVAPHFHGPGDDRVASSGTQAQRVPVKFRIWDCVPGVARGREIGNSKASLIYRSRSCVNKQTNKQQESQAEPHIRVWYSYFPLALSGHCKPRSRGKAFLLNTVGP